MAILVSSQVLGAFERVPSDGGSEGSAFSRTASLRGAVGKVMMANSFVRAASKGSAGKELLTLDDDSGQCQSVLMRVSADLGGLRMFRRVCSKPKYCKLFACMETHAFKVYRRTRLL